MENKPGVGSILVFPELVCKETSMPTLDNPYPNENRGATRFPYCTVVECMTAQDSVWGKVRDLSTEGLFVDIKDVFTVGDEIDFNFTLRSNRHTMNLKAEVVRKTHEGIGLKLL